MKSLRAAIDRKCRDCVYDDKSGLGTWREQISRCVCTDCPLRPVRTGPESGPYTRAKMDSLLAGGGESAPRAEKSATRGTTGADKEKAAEART